MQFILPVVVVVAAWWLSTAALMYRARLPRNSFLRTLGISTAVMLSGAWILVLTRDDASAAGAYLAFLGGLAIWAWHEVSYLFGFITGPRPGPCPPEARGWRRFVLGVQTCIYHELAIVATAAALAALTWTADNRVGLWTFVILWLMRWSAKLNIFLGVRNLHEEFWPEHLGYLKTFVRHRAMNVLFPISMLLAVAVLAGMMMAAIRAGNDSADRAGMVMLATLLGLAILEHGFLMLRIGDEKLWLTGPRTSGEGKAAAP